MTAEAAKVPLYAKKGAWATALLLVAGTAAAAIVWQQQTTVTNAAQASDVRFSDGGGGVTGFATIDIAAGGTSATMTLTGIVGATMTVTDLLRIQNTDVSQSYGVTLSRSAAPDPAIEALVFTVLDGSSTVATYDAAASASGSAWTLPASATYDIRVDMEVADGTAPGSLGAFTLRFGIAPA